MARDKVLITDPYFMIHEVVEGDILSQLQSAAEITYHLPHSEVDMLNAIKDASAIMLGDFPLTKGIIDTTEKLRIIARVGIGYNHIDLAAATSKRILVTNVPSALSEAVAEHAVMLMLAVARRLTLADSLARKSRWDEFFQRVPGPELAGKTLGIIGFGSIGTSVAQRGKAFGMKILLFDPYVNKQRAEEQNARQVGLEELLIESDVISIHTPLTDETKSLIGRREFSLMKKSAILINTARGAVIDEQALINTLKNREIAGAGLDVLSSEPPESTNALLSFDNVVLTPHCASFTLEACKRLWFACADAVMRVLRGELPQPPANIVNREVVSALSTSSS